MQDHIASSAIGSSNAARATSATAAAAKTTASSRSAVTTVSTVRAYQLHWGHRLCVHNRYVGERGFCDGRDA